MNRDGFDDLVVGAHYYDGGKTNEGGAFVYLGDPRPVFELAFRFIEDHLRHHARVLGV